MSEHLKRKIEEQNKLFTRMQEIQQHAEDESRDWTAEERTNWDAANTKIDEVSADIERLERAQHLDSIDYRNVVTATDGPAESPEERDRKHDESYSRAFGSYMRHGMERLDNEQRQMLLSNSVSGSELRAQGIATGAAGGYTVPPGFRAVMTETMKAYGGLINHANVITTSTGQPLQWPSNNDTGNVGQILSENTQIDEVDVTLGTKNIGAYTYTSRLVLVSLQLIQDSAFNLEQWLPHKLGQRIGRAVSAHLVAGTGSGQPTGLLPTSTVGVTAAVGGTTAITYDNLIDLEHSLDPAYRAADCRFIFHDTTLATLRKLKDSFGRPIWLPVPTVGFPATINGLPYTIDQGMPIPAANARSILFGDIHSAFIVRQVHDVQMVRMAERYMDYLQVGYFGFTRLDSQIDDPNAVAVFKQSAT